MALERRRFALAALAISAEWIKWIPNLVTAHLNLSRSRANRRPWRPPLVRETSVNDAAWGGA